jgi:hypothetical protein
LALLVADLACNIRIKDGIIDKFWMSYKYLTPELAISVPRRLQHDKSTEGSSKYW